MYHLLDSLVVFAGVGDVVSARLTHGLSIKIDGPFGGVLAGEADNLVLRAARALGGGGAALRLEKNLPVASGIGGGSADAAAALRVLRRLWTVPADHDLAGIALGLGADVPVCLGSAPARMGGIGEVLAPAPRLPDFGLVLVNPGVAVATPAVFRARTGAFSAPAVLPEAWTDARAMARDLAALSNDLQAPAVAVAPVIGTVLAALAALPGVLLARMSGSGATCFGIFGSGDEAAAAARLIQRPDWWVWGGGLYEGDSGDI